ncbi:MAG: hypothetical protein ILP16_08630 [Spirochaetales bacterium]|nr:hypothetical protein [Spirochaetales bacterium]
MKRLPFMLLLSMVLLGSVFSTTRIDSTAFDISAFKDGVPPRTSVRITTGVSNQFEYDYEGGASAENPVFDITASALLGSNTVSNALIIEVSTNERSNVSVTLTFTPFMRYDDGHVLDQDRSNWMSSRYTSSNPTVENGCVGVMENCVVKGQSYTYYSKLTTKAAFDTADNINQTIAKNSDGVSLTFTNRITVKDSSGATVAFPAGLAQSLSGIRNNLLTSKRVFGLAGIEVKNFEKGVEFISYVSVSISIE